MNSQDQFNLTPDETPRDRFGRPHPPAPAVKGGRRQGSMSKLTRELKAVASKRGIGFIVRMWDRAERLEDEIDYRCAALLFSRIWPRPRGNLVEIDLSQNIDVRTLLMAVASGQITPADASSLWNSISRNGTGASALIEAGGSPDIRQKVAARLAGLIEARQQQGASATAVTENLVEPPETLESMIVELKSWEGS